MDGLVDRRGRVELAGPIAFVSRVFPGHHSEDRIEHFKVTLNETATRAEGAFDIVFLNPQFSEFGGEYMRVLCRITSMEQLAP